MSLWDAQQREWLEAMGHSLLVLAADEVMHATAEPQAAAEASAEPSLMQPEPGQAAPGKPRQKVPSQTRVEDLAPTSPTPPERPRTDVATKAAALATARRAGARNAGGPLGDALARATGQAPAVAARTLRQLDVDQAALRDDPAAKRALWSRLRQLRKKAPRK